MRILDKYLLREYLVPVAYCLLAFSMIFVISDLFANVTDFMDVHTPLLLIVLYYLAVLAPNLEFLIPASLLLATLYSLWQLCRNNELTAMRATGVSFGRITMPFLAVGLVATFVSAGLKETVAPAANQWAEDFKHNDFKPLKQRLRRDQRYYNSHAHRQWHIGYFDLNDPTRLYRVEVEEEREDGTPSRTLLAKKALWLDGEWWFFSLAEQLYTREGYPKGDLTRIAGSNYGKRLVFPERPEDFVTEAKGWMFLNTAQMIRYLSTRPDLSKDELARKWFDIHSRLAMPWACLIVTLFGIPVGIQHGRQSALNGVFIAVALFFGFYALMQVGLLLGKSRIIWPWLGAWLSNIVFLSAGVIMARFKT